MEEISSVMPATKNITESTSKRSLTKWININIKIKDNELPILNQRLKLFGFETIYHI